MCFGFLSQSQYSPEEAIEVFPFGLTSAEPLCTPGVEGVFFLEILLRDGHEGREVMGIWVRCEDLRVGSTFRCYPSPELRVQQ